MNISEKNRRLAIHALLFVLTFITTTFAGAEWMFGRNLFYGEQTLSWNQIVQGTRFSIPFLLFLTVHEFGHFFAASYYGIKVTLPYYIPLWLGFIAAPSIGTGGAVIRIKETIKSRKEYFDVGIAGPLAGFVIGVSVLIYGFTNLPPLDFIFQIHPEYAQYGAEYGKHVYQEADEGSIRIMLGPNLLFMLLKDIFVPDQAVFPHPFEMIHYPYLLAGYLALLFTALNLLPIGQLDGGHILYSLIGYENHRVVSRVLFVIFIFYAGLGIPNPYIFDSLTIANYLLYLGFLYLTFYSFTPNAKDRLMYAAIIFVGQYLTLYIFPSAQGYSGWLLFAFLLGRFLGIYHPKVIDDRELSMNRKIIGWISLIIFILCFSPQPIIVDVAN